jgi:small basic protein
MFTSIKYHLNALFRDYVFLSYLFLLNIVIGVLVGWTEAPFKMQVQMDRNVNIVLMIYVTQKG